MNNNIQYKGCLRFFTVTRELKLMLCVVIVFAVLIFVPPGIAYGANCLSTLRIGGSTALYPLVDKAMQEYKSQKCLFSISSIPSPQGTTSVDGLKQLSQGNLEIGDSDIFADPTQKDSLQDHQVAIVVFALVVHKSKDLSSVTNLTKDQIKAIYGDFYKSWHQVNQTVDDKLPITIISRPADSGTRRTFDLYVLNRIQIAPGIPVADKSEDVAQKVCAKAGAIGYVSIHYYYIHQDCLQKLSIDGQAPTLEGVENPTKPYSFWNIEHMYSKKNPGEIVKSFMTFMYSDTVKEYIKQEYDQFGYLNISDIPANILDTHLSL